MPAIHLNSTHFSTTGGLHIWHIKETSDAGTIPAEIGGNALTRNGNLTQADNHLDTPESVFCVFDGVNDFLSSSAAVFGFTASANVGGWAHRNTWSGDFQGSYIGKARGGANPGWIMFFEESEIRFSTRDVSGTLSSTIRSDVSSLAAGWHHFVAVRNAGVNLKLFIDGQPATTVADTTDNMGIETQTFDISGRGDVGATKFDGRIQDAFVFIGTGLTDAEVLTIFNASAPAAVEGAGSILFYP